jgi:hypothetical protein
VCPSGTAVLSSLDDHIQLDLIMATAFSGFSIDLWSIALNSRDPPRCDLIVPSFGLHVSCPILDEFLDPLHRKSYALIAEAFRCVGLATCGHGALHIELGKCCSLGNSSRPLPALTCPGHPIFQSRSWSANTPLSQLEASSSIRPRPHRDNSAHSDPRLV